MPSDSKGTTAGGWRYSTYTLEGPHLLYSTSISHHTLLRRTIVNRTYGTHKTSIFLSIFTNNIWSYLPRSPVIRSSTIVPGQKNTGNRTDARDLHTNTSQQPTDLCELCTAVTSGRSHTDHKLSGVGANPFDFSSPLFIGFPKPFKLPSIVVHVDIHDRHSFPGEKNPQRLFVLR